MRVKVLKWISKAFLGILAISFCLFFGIGDIFRPSNPLAVIAQVGKEELSTQVFFSEVMQQVSALSSQISGEQLRVLDIPGQILHHMILDSLLSQEVKRLKLVVTDDQVIQAIRKIPRFQDKGKFSPDLLQAFFKQQRINNRAYIAQVREQLKKQQLIYAVLASPLGLQHIETLALNLSLQKRSGVWQVIKAHDQKVQGPVQEKVLKEFFRQHEEEYRIPEKRSITYLDMAEQDKTYNLLLQVEDQLASGATLEEAAKSCGVALKIAQGLDQKGSGFDCQNKPIGQNQEGVWPALVRYSFQLSQDETSTLQHVPGSGSFIVRVDQIQESVIPDFLKVRSVVEKAWKQEEQVRLADLEAQHRLISFPEKGTVHWTPNLTFDRDDKSQGKKVPELVRQVLFRLKVGQKLAISSGKDIYLIKLLRLQQPTDLESRKGHNTHMNFLRQHLKNDFLEAYGQSLKNRYPVIINQQAFEWAVQNYSNVRG